MKLRRTGKCVLTFILAVIFSKLMINHLHPILFGSRNIVLTFARIQIQKTTVSWIPEKQSEVKQLQSFGAGTQIQNFDLYNNNNFIFLVKDMESFMSRKDEQYAERRKRILLYCSQVNNTLSKEVTFNRLLFNKDSGIMGYS